MGRQDLEATIDRLTRNSMGLNVLGPMLDRRWPESTPRPLMTTGVSTVVAYLLLFCGLPYALHGGKLEPQAWSLIVLQFYGAFWAGWATVTTKLTAGSLARIVKADIIPALAPSTAEAIGADLRRDFDLRRVNARAWTIGVGCAVFAAVLVHCDLDGKVGWVEITWWAFGWCLLFATAAGVVDVGKYYAVFARHLEKEAGSLFVPDPGRSALLLSVAGLGQRMLLFWCGIAVSIGLVALLRWYKPFDFDPALAEGNFLLAEIALAGFCSVGIGSLVFLGSQAGIRRAIMVSRLTSLRAIESAALVPASRLDAIDEAGWKELLGLKDRHAAIASAGTYWSVLTAGISVIMPFIPLVTAILALAGYKPAR